MLSALAAAQFAAPASIVAQEPGSSVTVADTTCTYTRCSLWLDRGRLVQGAHAGLVSQGGFFRRMRVLPFVAGDSARHYATQYERSQRRASRFSMAGLTLTVAGFIVALSADCDPIPTPIGEWCQDDSAGPIAAGIVLGGYTLSLVSKTISIRGNRSLIRALWWHNSQYAR
jgi:hypothetical protein